MAIDASIEFIERCNMKKLTKKEFDEVLEKVDILSYEQGLNLISMAYNDLAKTCTHDSVKNLYTKKADMIYDFLSERGYYKR